MTKEQLRAVKKELFHDLRTWYIQNYLYGWADRQTVLQNLLPRIEKLADELEIKSNLPNCAISTSCPYCNGLGTIPASEVLGE